MQSLIFNSIESRGCTYDIHLSKLKVTINKIIKFILKLPCYTNSNFCYNELKVLHFHGLFKKYRYYLYINIKMLFQNVNIILILDIRKILV